MIDTVQVAGKNLTCEKVKYGDGNKHDPKDESNTWFRVLLQGPQSDVDFAPGSLIRVNSRHMLEQSLFGKIVYNINSEVIENYILKENVKESLFR